MSGEQWILPALTSESLLILSPIRCSWTSWWSMAWISRQPRLIENWWNRQALRVVIKGTTSSWRPLTSSIPQGLILDPVLLRCSLVIWMTRRSVDVLKTTKRKPPPLPPTFHLPQKSLTVDHRQICVAFHQKFRVWIHGHEFWHPLSSSSRTFFKLLERTLRTCSFCFHCI